MAVIAQRVRDPAVNSYFSVPFQSILWYNDIMETNGQNGGQGMPPQNYYYRQQRRGNAMITVSLVFAILAICSICTGILPVFFGSLSIIFAVVSRGGELRFKGNAKVCVLLSVLSIVAGITLTGVSIYRLQNDPAVRASVDQAFKQMYGVDYQEFMDGMQHYYETGEMPDFMEDMYQNRQGGYPGGFDL